MTSAKKIFNFGLICFFVFGAYLPNTSYPVLADTALPAPNHALMFGYYHAASQYGDFSNDVKDYTNTALIIQDSFIRADGTNDIAGFNNAFNKAIANNQKIVFLVSFSPDTLLSQGLEAARNYWNKIDLIYLADEPTWDKATTENNITSFKNTLSAKGLSQKQIAINYTNQQITSGTSYQASNLDVVGFEAYVDASQQNSTSLVNNLNTQIDQAKSKIGNRKMFIVIQGYNRNGAWTNLPSLQSIQTPSYLKAYNDPNMIGVFVFTYARPGGTKDLGSCISTEHKKIGAAILGTTQPAAVACTSSSGLSPITLSAQTNLGAGIFPDVTWYQGKVWLAVGQGGSLKLYSANANLSNFSLYKDFVIPIADNIFPKLAVYNNILWLAYRDGSDARLWRSDTSQIEDLGPAGGNDPVALGGGVVAWQNLSLQIMRRNLLGGTSTFVRNGSPTGISRIISATNIKTIDEERYSVAGYTRPWVAGGLTVTEGKNDGLFGFWNNPAAPFSIPASTFSIFAGEESFTPHAAASGNSYAVTTWGSTGVRVAVINKPNPGGAAPIGTFDGADCNVIGGWAADMDTPTTSIVVQIFIDGPEGTGTRIFSGITTGLRPDVNAAYNITGNHGFTINMPVSLKDKRDHEIWIYAQDSVTHQNMSFADNYKIFNSTPCGGTQPTPPPPGPTPPPGGPTPTPTPTPTFVAPVCDPLPADSYMILDCNLWLLTNNNSTLSPEGFAPFNYPAGDQTATLPGTTSNTTTTGDQSNQAAASNNTALPTLVNRIYIWSLGIAVLLALLMIVLGGYYYMTSGGNAEQSSKGKEYITSALIGVVILFCAYLLLNEINPDLVNFNLNSLNGLNSPTSTQTQTTNP